MDIRFAVCPSFAEGFAVELTERGTQGNLEYVIKTKGLGRDSWIRAKSLEALFGPIQTSQALDLDDAAQLEPAVLAIRISPAAAEWMSMDGTLISLFISRGETSIALEWNSETPPEWTGVAELAAFLETLYPKYRHLREPSA